MHRLKQMHVTSLLAAAVVFYSTAAFAQDNSLCAFLRKLIPTAQVEFADWKGAQRPATADATLTSFTGTLVPSAGTSCTLSVRRLSSTGILPPFYLCTLSEDRTYAQAVSLYNDTVKDLRSCSPNWGFTEEKSGKVSDGSESQYFTAKTSGLEIKVMVDDMRYLTQSPGATLTLGIYDEFPAADSHVPLPRVY